MGLINFSELKKIFFACDLKIVDMALKRFEEEIDESITLRVNLLKRKLLLDGRKVVKKKDLVELKDLS